MRSRSEIPLVEAVEVPDPLSAVRSLAGLRHPFLLHSAAPDERARWSFFGADPFAVFAAAEYDAARAMWRAVKTRVRVAGSGPAEVPFRGGVVGYWAYDFGRRLERLPAVAADDLGLPDVLLGFYDVVGAIHHGTQRAWLFSSGLPLESRPGERRARTRLRQFVELLSDAPHSAAPAPPHRHEAAQARSTFEPREYMSAVERVQDLIRAGDIFQANLSQRWTLSLDRADPTARALALSEALARFSPAPHAAFLGAQDHAVASASPERFLRLRGRHVETRPIKGTRPRGLDPADDERLRAELLASAKDRAENVMIVDVLRNDLGRVCEAGSVEVESLCELEAFPQVFHLTSTVTGILNDGRDAFDLLHACFPGGSITGAPKIRAMEILERLEPVRRHLYTGAIGYVDWGGDADWNIAIRTAIVTPGALHFAAGGGITADSDPESEYRETLDKAAGMRVALEQVTGPVALGSALAGRS